MNLGKSANDGHQFALPRHIEAGNRVPRLFGMKGNALDDSQHALGRPADPVHSGCWCDASVLTRLTNRELFRLYHTGKQIDVQTIICKHPYVLFLSASYSN